MRGLFFIYKRTDVTEGYNPAIRHPTDWACSPAAYYSLIVDLLFDTIPFTLESKTPFIIASSVTAKFSSPDRFSLFKTVEIAAGKADGVQLYVNPGSQELNVNGIAQLKDKLAVGDLNVNVAHIPEYLTPLHLGDKSGEAIIIASDLLNSIHGVGKLCVIHHDPYSENTDREIVESTSRLVNSLHDPDIAIGLEHFHPFNKTTQLNLGEQVGRYISLLQRLQEQVPTFAVIDLGRFYSIRNVNTPPAPLTDPDHSYLEGICEATAGQSVLVHAADKTDMNKSFHEPGIAVPIGMGIFAPLYRKMNALGKKYSIRWIGVVDETESVNAISDRRIVQDIFR